IVASASVAPGLRRPALPASTARSSRGPRLTAAPCVARCTRCSRTAGSSGRSTAVVSYDSMFDEGLAPGLQLALEAPGGVGRAGGRQAQHRQPEGAGDAHAACRLAAVVRDRPQPRGALAQANQVVVLGAAD